MPPPPGAAYRVLVKAGMRPRKERVLLLTAMATHVVFTSALLAPSALWRPRVAAGTAALVFGALLPLLLVRRTRLLAAAPEPASRCVSRGAYVAALARSAAAWQDIGLHALLGGVLALVYSLTATYAFGWSAATAPARFVPAHGVYYVNEAWLVLLALSTALGAVYAAAVLVLLPGARSGVPPFDAGATHSSDTRPLPRAATTPVGAPGTEADDTGVTAADSSDCGPVPTLFFAATRNV